MLQEDPFPALTCRGAGGEATITARTAERFGLSAEEAFAVLRRHSQDTNTKLRIGAASVATGELEGDAIGRRP